MVYCVGCGASVQDNVDTCSLCSSAVAGSFFAEMVLVEPSNPLKIPAVCCCCLNDRQLVKEAKVSGGLQIDLTHGYHQRVLKVPLPWCRRCWWFQSILFAIPLTIFIVGSVLLTALLADRMGREPGAGVLFLGVIAGGVAALSARWVLGMLIRDLRGHVPACQAYESRGLQVIDSARSAAAATKPTPVIAGAIIFRNRAFAELWRSMQPKA